MNDHPKQPREKRTQTRPGRVALKAGWPDKFVAALRELPNVSFACRKAGIVRMTAYQRRASHPDFAAAWDDAMQQGIDALEEAAMERATKGVKRGVWLRGPKGNPKRVETIYEASDQLAMFLLKGNRPDRYREPKGTDLSAQIVTQTSQGETKAEFTVHVTAEELP